MAGRPSRQTQEPLSSEARQSSSLIQDLFKLQWLGGSVFKYRNFSSVAGLLSSLLLDFLLQWLGGSVVNCMNFLISGRTAQSGFVSRNASR